MTLLYESFEVIIYKRACSSINAPVRAWLFPGLVLKMQQQKCPKGKASQSSFCEYHLSSLLEASCLSENVCYNNAPICIMDEVEK